MRQFDELRMGISDLDFVSSQPAAKDEDFLDLSNSAHIDPMMASLEPGHVVTADDLRARLNVGGTVHFVGIIATDPESNRGLQTSTD